MKPDELEKITDEEQAAIFAAFSDPTRLKLVHLLAHQEVPGAMCVNALAGKLGVTQSAVSQHLRILKIRVIHGVLLRKAGKIGRKVLMYPE